MAKLSIVRLLLSVAANLYWLLQQYDVKNVFLLGELYEEIYMSIPPSYSTYGNTDLACKLKKSLNGMKQSPRAWFGRFRLTVKKYGEVQSNTNHSIFLKMKNGNIVFLIIYVDDMIVTGDDVD